MTSRSLARSKPDPLEVEAKRKEKERKEKAKEEVKKRKAHDKRVRTIQKRIRIKRDEGDDLTTLYDSDDELQTHTTIRRMEGCIKFRIAEKMLANMTSGTTKAVVSGSSGVGIEFSIEFDWKLLGVVGPQRKFNVAIKGFAVQGGGE